MDEKTMLKVEQMLQSVYQFLDFGSKEGHETWYQMLKQYSNEDALEGTRQYIRAEAKTPTVADLIEYIQPFSDKRLAEARHNLAILNASKVSCMECNDRGYVWVQYPNCECCRPCGCESARQRFGDDVFRAAKTDPDRELIDRFGGGNAAEAMEIAKRYRKVIYYKGEKGHDVIIRYEKKEG